MPSKRMLSVWVCVAIVACAVPTAAQGGNDFHTTVPTDVLTQFRDQRILWTSNIWTAANRLFFGLALIEFAWSAAVMALEKSELQSWSAALIRKFMWIGAFYALLLYGNQWIPAIINSFSQIGATAAGMSGPLAPSDVFMQGLSIAGALMDQGSILDFFSNPGSSFALVVAAILIMISYTLITVNFIMTMVESYLVISVGYIFLGFGGSRWTVPYTERYLGLAVSIGVKILLLYCLISAGMNLGVAWATEAQNIGSSPRPVMVCFDCMGGALIFMACCWGIPKLFAAVIGGAPALAGGDLIGPTTTVAGAGVLAATVVAVPAALAAGALKTGGAASIKALSAGPIAGGGGAGVSSVGHGAYVPPPSGAPPSAGQASAPTSPVDPPPSSGKSGGSAGTPGPATNATAAPVAKQIGGRLSNFDLGDGAPHHTPPEMPINHHDD